LNFLKSISIPSLSGTFGIRSKPTHEPKMPKEPSSPSRYNTRVISDPEKQKFNAVVK
jgi:hypothetical protein